MLLVRFIKEAEGARTTVGWGSRISVNMGCCRMALWSSRSWLWWCNGKSLRWRIWFHGSCMDGGVATNLVVRHCAHWDATLVWQKLTICQQLFFVFLFGIREWVHFLFFWRLNSDDFVVVYSIFWWVPRFSFFLNFLMNFVLVDQYMGVNFRSSIWVFFKG